ncbi:DUF3846 domain-containing protein [Rhodococcus erythropolis]|uniref:DUF3846 domain-containing protein n=1 Tax=Rhodococcus erythropolis TaxID=1833 RepID=UPI0012481F62|nr:DUF3846 domain-containing protein [Rhodococcus erythropolis]QEX10911.1 DUF3846 domain-containing protein [Rhodococcus erythropolis]
MKKIRCIVIPVDLDAAVDTLEFFEGDLSAMQGLVEGLVQAVDLEQQKATLWFNESGKIEHLPKNQRATMELWSSDSRWRFQDFVAGNAFITGLSDEDGETTSVPQELVDLMLSTAKYRAEVTTLNDEDSWSSNNLEFPDYWEAAHSVLELASRWRMVSNCRVIAA